MASNNITRIRKHIQNFSFEDLFIDELGWDQYHDQLPLPVDDQVITLDAFAQKRGLVAFHYGGIPEYRMRRKIEQQVAKSHRENIIIYTDLEATQQIWQWVRREPGRPLANRERRFHRGHTGENIAQILANITFSLAEEDTLTIVDVTSRVRAAFDVEEVTKQFYDRFKRQHDTFLKFIEGIPDEDLLRWYASVMLNRLMFIYFVQRKLFLDNDPDYLRHRLEQAKGNFYRDFLCPLFFEGFAKKDHPAQVRALLGDIPYLNGGLFLRHQIEEQYGEAIQIANTAFEKLFDFFDDYHWHLDERPLRNDKEINPDVLGYIFEKYINQKQMGAYYTKEDITEYISKNTVIPFLFDEARKAVKIAFEGEHTVWDLLVETPDRYIYPAMRHGVEYLLPENIAAGLDEVSQRADWNTPAPSEYGLPTEIWREVVARRTRYAEVRQKLVNGEVRQINDLITYNLDIQQFAQDVIDYTDSPDVVRAFWKAINAMTVLDPTCGSGAFLFAALNILEPLYEACVERMEGFVAEMERTGDRHPQTFKDFREVLTRIEQHPNRRYFILKSIIVNNLFGVDIMEEAVEICKLRLFLKLVAQVDDKSRIEPLPDIDFNIRAGNTLVGFATLDQLKQAITNPCGNAPKLLLLPEDEASLKEIERKAQDVDRLFGRFREQQTTLGGEVRPEDKAELNRRLRILEAELNHLLAGQYGTDASKEEQYTKWLKSHRPFHWFIEFYGVLKNGGFDVIIGNPPYVEYRKVEDTYTVQNYRTEYGKNLYIFTMERSMYLVSRNGRTGMIVPIALLNVRNTNELRSLLLEEFGTLWLSSYAIRPTKLFDGVEQRLTIFIGSMGTSPNAVIWTSKYNQWYSNERSHLFALSQYAETSALITDTYIPKVGNSIGWRIIDKINATSNYMIRMYLRTGTQNRLFFHRTPGYWIRIMDFEPYFKSPTSTRSIHHIRELNFANPAIAKFVGAVVSSSMYFYWFFAVGNCRNLTLDDVKDFPIGMPSDNLLRQAGRLFDELMESYKEHSVINTRGVTEFQEFNWAASKPIIDDIDRILAQHYNFTNAELDFIINYDIKIRMGDDLVNDGEDNEE